MSLAETRTTIDHGRADLSVSRKCRLPKPSRSSLCNTPVGTSTETLELTEKIDKVFTAYPFFGSRPIKARLRRDDAVVGLHRVRRLMAKIGLEAIHRRPNTSRRHPQRPIYPYLQRSMTITRPNQIWSSDVTFIPVRGGFPNPVAIMDWATRKE